MPGQIAADRFGHARGKQIAREFERARGHARVHDIGRAQFIHRPAQVIAPHVVADHLQSQTRPGAVLAPVAQRDGIRGAEGKGHIAPRIQRQFDRGRGIQSADRNRGGLREGERVAALADIEADDVLALPGFELIVARAAGEKGAVIFDVQVILARAAIEDIPSQVILKVVSARAAKEQVVASAALDSIVAALAREEVIAFVAMDLIISLERGDVIIAGRAADQVRERGRCRHLYPGAQRRLVPERAVGELDAFNRTGASVETQPVLGAVHQQIKAFVKERQPCATRLEHDSGDADLRGSQIGQPDAIETAEITIDLVNIVLPVAGPEQVGVVALAAVQPIVARAAVEHVFATKTRQAVVTAQPADAFVAGRALEVIRALRAGDHARQQDRLRLQPEFRRGQHCGDGRTRRLDAALGGIGVGNPASQRLIQECVQQVVRETASIERIRGQIIGADGVSADYLEFQILRVVVVGDNRRRPTLQQNAFSGAGADEKIPAGDRRADLGRVNAAAQRDCSLVIEVAVGVEHSVEAVAAVERDDPAVRLQPFDIDRVLARTADDDIRGKSALLIDLAGPDQIIACPAEKEIVAAKAAWIWRAAVVEQIIARAAVDHVEARSAIKTVGAVPARQNIVAGIPVNEVGRGGALQDVVLVAFAGRLRGGQRREFGEAQARAIREAHRFDAPPPAAQRSVLQRREHDAGDCALRAVADIERGVDAVVIVAGGDAIDIERSPRQLQVARSDAGPEGQGVGAAGRPALAVAPALENHPWNRLVDDVRATIGGQQKIRVVALVTGEVIGAGIVVQHVIVQGPDDGVVAGIAVQERTDSLRAPAVGVDEVVARTGIHRHDAAVAQVEEIVRSAPDNGFDGQDVVGRRAGVLRGHAIDGGGVALLGVDADIAAAAETRQFGTKAPARTVDESLASVVHGGDGGARGDGVQHGGKDLLLAGIGAHAPVAGARIVVREHQFGSGIEHRQMQVIAAARRVQIGKLHAFAQAYDALFRRIVDDRIGPAAKRKDVTVRTRSTLQRIVALPAVEHIVSRKSEKRVGVLRAAQNIVLLCAYDRRDPQAIERR